MFTTWATTQLASAQPPSSLCLSRQSPSPPFSAQSMAVRSTTGCLTCKSRKKKCDETHPKCRRCAESGRECGGYAPLASPDSRGVMRRVKAVLPRPASENVSTVPLQIVSWPSKVPSHSHTFTFSVSTITPNPAPTIDRQYRNAQGYLETVDPQPRYPSHRNVRRNSGSLLDYLPNRNLPPSAIIRPPIQRRNIIEPSTGPYPPPSRPATTSSTSSGNTTPPKSPNDSPPSTVARRYSPSVTQAKQTFTPGQASLFEALFSLGDSEPSSPKDSSPSPKSLVPRVVYGPSWPSPNIRSKIKEQPATVDHDDPEGFQPALCKTLAPDPNTRDNSLAFVLQSYACWIKSNVFDPMKVVDDIRECIIEQFAGPQELRTRIILLSNVMGSLGKGSKLNGKSLSLISSLRIETHQTMQRFHSTKPTGQHTVDKLEATKTLDHTIETLVFQRFTGSLSTVVKLLQDTAPVFRRACPEFPERVNLASALLEPNLHLRHFGAIDVLLSVTTARPMLFKYDVSYTPEMADQMMRGDSGIQWLYGVPDQFIILLAWINVLYDDFGNAVDPQHVLDVERHIKNFKIVPPTAPADPHAVVWRFIVQECWRQIVYIYLYMMLCGDQADDPRVMEAVKVFIRLVSRVKSGRNPDSYLFFPLIIAGASAHDAEDRNFIHQRMQSLRECALPGTCGHECLLILNDIWERTEAENRPAVWRDLRIASLKVAGV